MNDIEALHLFLNGKKLTRTSWSSGRYIVLNTVYIAGNVVWDSATNLSSNLADYFYGAGNWDIYLEPKQKIKLAQAIYYIAGHYYTSRKLFKSEEEAKNQFGADFVRWPMNQSEWVEFEE